METQTVIRELSEEDDRFAFTEEAFAASAEATRHVWDTPEEDEAWAHLQTDSTL